MLIQAFTDILVLSEYPQLKGIISERFDYIFIDLNLHDTNLKQKVILDMPLTRKGISLRELEIVINSSGQIIPRFDRDKNERLKSNKFSSNRN